MVVQQVGEGSLCGQGGECLNGEYTLYSTDGRGEHQRGVSQCDSLVFCKYTVRKISSPSPCTSREFWSFQLTMSRVSSKLRKIGSRIFITYLAKG